MSTLQKMKMLGESSQYDLCGCGSKKEIKLPENISGIYKAIGQGGQCITLFKTLYTNKCGHDCKYCINCGGKRFEKYEPEELADTFNHLNKKGLVDGLFLTSAIPNGEPDKIVEEMVQSVKLIRFKHNFKGYIHFKILPGTSKYLVEEASKLVDRMSINIEAPSSARLAELSSSKVFNSDILKRQAWIRDALPNGSQTTQMVVGAGEETDWEILRMADFEYEAFELTRTYYSAFSPVKGTILENKERESPLREHRLYNVDFMMRQYNIKLNEFKKIMNDSMLPREDPKVALAKANFNGAIDLNEASYNEIIRIPGIGPKTANKIMELRKNVKFTKYEQLKNAGVIVERAKPFIEVDGNRQKMLMEF